MNGRAIGPGGVPIIGGAGGSQPIQPIMDLTRVFEGPNGEKTEQRFRVPGVGVVFMDPGVVAELAQQIAPLIAPLIVQAVLEVAAQAAPKPQE